MTSSPPGDLRLLAGGARRPAAPAADPVSASSLGSLATPIWNPPDAPSLAFRPGTYETFLSGMLARLRVQPVPPDGDRPLANLHLGEPRDWLLGLTESWAVVGDVLTFYLERIANEGYLGTAVEPFSIWQLLRTIGYAPRPGIAGTTHLAFTVASGRRLPEGVTVPQQTQVRSLPSGNQLPQVYELDAPLQARASWSALKPLAAGRTARPPLRVGATSIALEGTRTGLRAGSGLLIVADGGATRMYRTLTSVAVERTRPASTTAADGSLGGTGGGATAGSTGSSMGARGVTIAAWEEPLARDPGSAGDSGVFASPRAYGFAKRVHLFGYNAIPWDQVPDAGKMAVCPRRGGISSSDDRGAAFRSDNEGLPTTQVLTLAFDADGQAIAGTAQGFFRATADGWQAPTAGLGKIPIQALCIGARGQLFAGTPSGVYRSTDSGATWSFLAPAALALRRSSGKLPDLGSAATLGDKLKSLVAKVRALVAKIFPSLAQKVRPEPRLTGQPVLALAASGDRDANFLFAGTAQGIYRTLASGGGWQPTNQGLPQLDPATGLADVTVRAFATGADPGTLFAATDQGLFRSTDAGLRWRGAGWGYPRTKNGPAAAHAVAVATDARSRQTFVFAATDAGVYRSSDGGDRFTAVCSGLPAAAPGTLGAAAPVRRLAAALDETTLSPLLYAATGDDATGLYRSDDLGDSWRLLATPAGSGETLPSLSALAAGGRQLLIATPFDGFLCDQWPGYHLAAGQIDLSTTVPDLLPSGWAVLNQSRPQPAPFPPLPPLVGAYPIHGVETVAREDFGISAQVTRLEVTDDGRLAQFDLRTTEANVVSSELPLARLPSLEPLEGARLKIDLPLAEAPGAGRMLAIAGRRIRAALAPDAPPRPLATDEKTLPTTVGPGDRLMILAAPGSLEGGSSSGPPAEPSIRWHVETASGVRGRMIARRDELAWQSAGDDDPTIAETVSCLGATAVDPTIDPAVAPAAADDHAAAVAGTAPAAGTPRAELLVSPALRYLYDPSTVTINANVATASQGETIPNEVIGSGNANRANQRFTLRGKPLTFVPDAKTGYRSTLTVLVDGVAWREVTTLYGQGPASRVYALEIDETGAAAVTFGDGTYGARLPTGVENVVARYRFGQWAEAQPSAALRLLQSRPFGLREVTNPEPAPGAIPPEGYQNARTLGPRAVRALDRIVALDDYADFALTFPGISRAATAVVWNGRSRLIALTIAGADGAPVPEDSELYRTLSAAIHGRRYLARPLAIASYAQVGFSLAARVQVAAGTGTSTDDLKKALRAALTSAFGFAARGFGQGVASSEVIAALQAVPGVLAVELDALYRGGTPPGLADFLPADLASWDSTADRLAPAEILLVDPQGILLNLPGDPGEAS
ncbi:MAG TPA: putative baseplate assembly protein [Thermoanaerobaculia bacterium]|jgi:hypothetical protein|nr:putative baseplate assembly protein [Thermoanaerobaculia bacterium]